MNLSSAENVPLVRVPGDVSITFARTSKTPLLGDAHDGNELPSNTKESPTEPTLNSVTISLASP